MSKYVSKCCGADWRYPVTPDPTGEGRAICTECQRYCLLEQVSESSRCKNGCDGIKAVCSDCPTTNLTGKKEYLGIGDWVGADCKSPTH